MCEFFSQDLEARMPESWREWSQQMGGSREYNKQSYVYLACSTVYFYFYIFFILLILLFSLLRFSYYREAGGIHHIFINAWWRNSCKRIVPQIRKQKTIFFVGILCCFSILIYSRMAFLKAWRKPSTSSSPCSWRDRTPLRLVHHFLHYISKSALIS